MNKKAGQQEEKNNVEKTVKLREEESGTEKTVKLREEESGTEMAVKLREEESGTEMAEKLQEEESGTEMAEKTQAEECGAEMTVKAQGSVAKKVKIWVIVGFVIVILLLAKLIFKQQIDSVESLQLYMKRFGIAAPLVLTVFQALQVVVPVLPGYLGCAAGAVAFGTMTGFWCNYIGISLGSIIAYFLAKKYGKSIVLSLFPQKQYEKWSGVVEKSRSYGWFLFVATLLPLFPDDFLCYFSGLMKMNSKKFIWIIILGKPWCILAYSIGFGLIR